MMENTCTCHYAFGKINLSEILVLKLFIRSVLGIFRTALLPYIREILPGIILYDQNLFLLLCVFLFSITDFHLTVCLSLSFNFKSTAPKRQWKVHCCDLRP